MAAWVKGCDFQKHCGCTGLFFQGQAEIGFALGSIQEFLIQQAAQIRVEIILNRKRLINRAGIQRADLFQRFFRFRCAQVIRCFLQIFHKTRRRLAHHTFIADAAAHLQVCAVNIHNFFVFRQVAHHFALHFLPFTHAVGQLLFFLLAFILLHQQAQRTQAALAGKQHIFSANTGPREHTQVVQQPRAADIIGQQRNIFLGIQLTVKGIIRVFFNIIDIDLAVFTTRLLVAARDLI